MNIEILHTFQEKKHYLGKCRIVDILGAMSKIDNWEYNRPPDLERSREISRAISQQQNAIDWILHFAYDKDTESFLVIDGIHRLYALEMANEICEWSSSPTQFIILNFKVDASKGELIDWFHAINNSNPVPELYLRDSSAEKRECIEKIAREWQEKYPGHFMFSKKPNIGHINRDRLMDILDVLYEKYKNIHSKLISTEDSLREKMEHKNNDIRENPPKKISPKVLEKCMKSGCFLFLQKTEWLSENI